MLTTQQIDALNHCLKCSICVDNCPVARVNPQFLGPKKLAIDWLRIAQEDGASPSPYLDYCSNCKTCETVCPSNVRIATLNQLTKSDFPTTKRLFRKKLLSDPALMGKMIHLWPGAGNAAMRLPAMRFCLGKTLGISAQAPMPVYSHHTFRHRPKKVSPTREVVYFPGCFARYNKPEIGQALVNILTRLNYKVIVPDFACCGQASISNAHLRNTAKFARHNLRLLRETLGTKPLLFTCPSCLLTFKEEYKNILDLREYADLAPQMQDAGQFLLEHRAELADLLPQRSQPAPALAYHEPCHLRASGQGTPGFFLLKNVAGLSLTPLEAGCCGLAGSYGLKEEKQWVAEAIGGNIQHAVNKLDVQGVVTECGMCATQIRHLTHLPVYHPLEALLSAALHSS
jgi:glycerol-3-phosphate dehydrogenase subunit C